MTMVVGYDARMVSRNAWGIQRTWDLCNLCSKCKPFLTLPKCPKCVVGGRLAFRLLHPKSEYYHREIQRRCVCRPASEKAIESIQLPCPVRGAPTLFLIAVSHKRIVVSPAEAMSLPSGKNATERTEQICDLISTAT
jgi:hypothetical protein